jgi:hypothetical protein
MRVAITDLNCGRPFAKIATDHAEVNWRLQFALKLRRSEITPSEGIQQV